MTPQEFQTQVASLDDAAASQLAERWGVINPRSPITPDNITPNSGLLCWWTCPDNDHEYQATVFDRTQISFVCPMCRDLWIARKERI